MGETISNLCSCLLKDTQTYTGYSGLPNIRDTCYLNSTINFSIQWMLSNNDSECIFHDLPTVQPTLYVAKHI